VPEIQKLATNQKYQIIFVGNKVDMRPSEVTKENSEKYIFRETVTTSVLTCV
jgi:ribosome biogenesis GTPase A